MKILPRNMIETCMTILFAAAVITGCLGYPVLPFILFGSCLILPLIAALIRDLIIQPRGD